MSAAAPAPTTRRVSVLETREATEAAPDVETGDEEAEEVVLEAAPTPDESVLAVLVEGWYSENWRRGGGGGEEPDE